MRIQKHSAIEDIPDILEDFFVLRENAFVHIEKCICPNLTSSEDDQAGGYARFEKVWVSFGSKKFGPKILRKLKKN